MDLSLNQLHGSILGNPQTVPGPVNTAYKFDGINDVIVVNHQECFNSIDTAFTVSGWVNPFSVANGNTWLAFICKGNELGLNSSPFSVLYNNDNNDLVPFIRYTDEQGNFVKYAYPTTYGVELNKWTFFTWTFDKGLTKVYKNGQLIGTTTISITHLLKTDQPFEMGRDYPGFPEKLDGILDDICLFNKALSDDQVLDMYQNKHCFTPVPETQLKTICEGESYLGFTQTGTYYDTVKQLNGCHALQEIHLKVLPDSKSEVFKEICRGETFDGLSDSGSYPKYFTASNGCDSTSILHLTVNDLVKSTQKAEVCPNSIFTYKGKSYSPPAMIVDTIQALAGCDTILTIDLSVSKNYNLQHSFSLCKNQIFIYKNQTYKAPTTITDTLISTTDCDTIFKIELSISQYPEKKERIELCSNQTYNYKGKTYSPPTEIRDTLSFGNECDTILIIELELKELPRINREFKICKGDFVEIAGKIYKEAGIINDTIFSAKDCDTIRINTIIQSPEPEKFLPRDTIICDGQTFRFTSPHPITIWNQKDSTNFIEIDKAGLISVYFFNDFGCPNTDSLEVRACCGADGIYVPNAFSPNDDGVNDLFQPFAADRCNLGFQYEIYDRWGELIYEGTETAQGWNGKFREKTMPTGVYVWILKYLTGVVGKEILRKGDVTLVR